jgi:hypothetical protein
LLYVLEISLKIGTRPQVIKCKFCFGAMYKEQGHKLQMFHLVYFEYLNTGTKFISDQNLVYGKDWWLQEQN